MRISVGAGIATSVALLVAACAPAAIQPATLTVEAQQSVERQEAAAPPDPTPEVVWPLTGLSAEGASPEDLAKVAIAIKVPNDPSHSRPQKNIEYADIVFEEYVEAGIPRFVAVFQSVHPEEVGPVRSMREMDPNIVGSFGGPLVFSGANSYVLNYARGTGQLLIAQDVGSDGFFRTNDRPSPYNLHVTLADVVAQSAGLSAPAPQFQYAYPSRFATALEQGTDTSLISLKFSRYGEPSWEWDSNSQRWLRDEFGEDHVTVDGARIGAENVLVLFVRIEINRDLPVSQMIVSNSPGYLASGGKYIPILWSKADRTSPFVITTEAGEPVTLVPGTTWIELIPNAGIAVGSAEFS